MKNHIYIYIQTWGKFPYPNLVTTLLQSRDTIWAKKCLKAFFIEKNVSKKRKRRSKFSPLSKYPASRVWRAVYTRSILLNFTAASLSAITRDSIFMSESCTQQSVRVVFLIFILDSIHYVKKNHWDTQCVTFEDHRIRTMLAWIRPLFIQTILKKITKIGRFFRHIYPCVDWKINLKNHLASCTEERNLDVSF